MRERIPNFLFILLLVLIAVHMYMNVTREATGITQPSDLWEISITVGIICTSVLFITFLYQSIFYCKDENGDNKEGRLK